MAENMGPGGFGRLERMGSNNNGGADGNNDDEE